MYSIHRPVQTLFSREHISSATLVSGSWRGFGAVNSMCAHNSNALAVRCMYTTVRFIRVLRCARALRRRTRGFWIWTVTRTTDENSVVVVGIVITCTRARNFLEHFHGIARYVNWTCRTCALYYIIILYSTVCTYVYIYKRAAITGDAGWSLLSWSTQRTVPYLYYNTLWITN